MQRKILLLKAIIVSLIILLIGTYTVSAQNVGETISIEGYVEAVASNSLLVDGKVLVPTQYSSMNTNGENIYVGDYLMGFIYLNQDMQSYSIVSLTKVFEKGLGTPTPTMIPSPTPLWNDLFTPTPGFGGQDGQASGGLVLLSDLAASPEATLNPLEIFNVSNATPVPTLGPTATPANLTFEGELTKIEGNKIYIGTDVYALDNSTGYKNENEKPKEGDYVKGRITMVGNVGVVRFIETIPEYERPDVKSETVYGLFAGQDKTKITVSTPNGEKEFLFYSGTKMNKTFYTKGTLVAIDAVNNYMKSITEYQLMTSGAELEPINGQIKHIVKFSDNETYFISGDKAYFVRGDATYSPNKESFAEGKSFVGLSQNGQVAMLVFTTNNRVKKISGTVSSLNKSDMSNIRFSVSGTEYVITENTMMMGRNIARNGNVFGYADSANEVFYLTSDAAWYTTLLSKVNWTLAAPAALVIIGLILFISLYRTKVDGFLQEANGNIVTITDSRGENPRHYTCTDEIARFAPSLLTMKVKVTVYHGKVIHIEYDF